MIEVVKEEGIQFMSNIPLVHALLDMADVMEYILHEYILHELIASVAEVLCWVKEIKGEQMHLV
jgi:flagellar biosynthesis protein FlhB